MGLLLAVDMPDGRCREYAYDAYGQRTEKRVGERMVEACSWLEPLRLSESNDECEW
ncbi:hypothetical protein JCM14124_27830 [Humidesulfovibrio idahonensis]